MVFQCINIRQVPREVLEFKVCDLDPKVMVMSADAAKNLRPVSITIPSIKQELS